MNSFDCEEVEARLGIIEAQRDAVNPADRIRTVNVEIAFSKRSSSTVIARLSQLWIAEDDEEIEGHRRTKTLPLDSRGNPRRWGLAVANRVHSVNVEISSHREVYSSFIAKRISADVVKCTRNSA